MSATDAMAPYTEGVSSILVVEDDPSLRLLLVRNLRESGFNVVGASAGPEMWVALRRDTMDLVLLDVMLPGASGLDLCRTLRQTSAVPIILLSARGDEVDRVVGLELGADDYITKPFGTKELLARVRALLRRVAMRQSAPATEFAAREIMSFGGWTVDLRRRQVCSPAGAEVELSGAEYDLLVSFAGHPQRVIGRERLLELSRTRLSGGSDRSIDVLISRLRRKLADPSGKETLIRTVRGVGYIFTAKVQRT